MRRTKEDAAKTRELILKTALICFDTQGYEYTSLSDIAKAAGLTRGAIYWHFKNKADILQVIADEQLSSIISEIETLLQGQNTWQHIGQFWQHFFRQLHEIPERGQFFRLMEQTGSSCTPLLQDIDRKYSKLWQDLSQRAIMIGIEEGDIYPQANPEWLRFYNRTITMGLLTMHLHYPNTPNLFEYSDQIIATHIASLRQPL